MSEDKSFLKRLLTETWPALDRGNFGTMSAAEGADLGPTAIDNLFRSTANHLGKSALKAVMLPGDVYQGKVSIYDDDGRPNPEVIERAFDLAGLVTLGAGAVPAEANSLRSGIKAYHGSPHDFEKFDLSKIGTGEGAQVYGHGLYFADNEAVARSYRDTFAQADMPQKILNSLKAIDHLGFDTPNQAIRAIRSNKDWMKRWDVDPRRSAEEAQAIGNINKYVSSPRAHMYEVNINADPARFLDWDKPLSGQSGDVRSALENLGIKYDAKGDKAYTEALLDALTGDANRALPKEVSNPLGSELYRRNGSVFQTSSDPVRSAAFREAGIPGIKYLDQGSRGAGEGSRNYVVFDDKIIDILRKYGLAGASASPLAALMAGQSQGELQQ